MAFEIDPSLENPTHLAAESLGHGILDALIHELDKFKKPFRQLPEFEQNAAIENLRVAVKTLVYDTMGVLFRGQYPACVATLAGVKFGDSITAVLTINKDAKHRHELSDAIKRGMVLVIADPERYLERMEEIRGSAAQGELVLHRPEAMPPDAPKADVVPFPGVDREVVAGDASNDTPRPLASIGDSDGLFDAAVMTASLRDLGFDCSPEDILKWTQKQRMIAGNYAERCRMYPQTSQPVPAFLRDWKLEKKDDSPA